MSVVQLNSQLHVLTHGVSRKLMAHFAVLIGVAVEAVAGSIRAHHRRPVGVVVTDEHPVLGDPL